MWDGLLNHFKPKTRNLEKGDARVTGLLGVTRV